MPRYKNSRKTWEYSTEFKSKAVELTHLDGVKVRDVAESLGIHPFMLSKWRGEYRDGKIPPSRGGKRVLSKPDKPKNKADAEFERLQKENERLKQENDLLKKWQRYLAEQHQKGLDSSKSSDES